MRINNIELYNFGSYEGVSFFDTKITDQNKNIIIIGGKNGAGKTTLFTAIRICIYGHRAFGYQSSGAFYNKNIFKRINNTVKMNCSASAYVKLNISINNGQSFDDYTIKRTWNIDSNSALSEKFSVSKNENELKQEAVYDFEKFITQIIPPELFDLYFFDGEKIADFFLEDGSNARIKNAFLTICKYDTFDIMSKYFKKASGVLNDNRELFYEYLETKKAHEESENKVEKLRNSIFQTEIAIEEINANISSLDLNYIKSGGITKKEWSLKIEEINQEEFLRKEKNGWLKNIANNYVPFLIIKDLLSDVLEQIEVEEEDYKTTYFLEHLQKEHVREIFVNALNEKKNIDEVLSRVTNEIMKSRTTAEAFLNLSPNQASEVKYLIGRVFSFDVSKISKEIAMIKKSIKRTKKIRGELENCSADYASSYIEKKNEYLKLKDEYTKNRLTLESGFKNAEVEESSAKECYLKAKKIYEGELKGNSIKDISAKAVFMLDELKESLFTRQIEKMEREFRIEISRLIRKSKFVDDISIDKQFNIHIYRNEAFCLNDIRKLLNHNSEKQLKTIFSETAFLDLEKIYIKISKMSSDEVENNKEIFVLPIEIDKSSMSNGEKQIFIMALYKSLMQLCNLEVPFVIDTPFARIDSEHRFNIVENFFKELKGQIFILSTNEEINSKHLSILGDKILNIYMLKNDDNERTMISKGNYFNEVEQ